MNRFGLWNAAMLVWLFLLFNIERIHEPINLASFVYVLCTVLAVFTVALPTVVYESRPLLVGVILAVYFSLKVYLGYPIAGAHLPLTVTELCALAVTLLLGRKIAWNVLRFEKAAVDALTADLWGRALPFETGQAEIYREICRAREFHRPLALVSLAPTSDTRQAASNELVQQVQQESMAKYVDASLADLLAQQTNDCDVVTHANGRFVVLLAEADPERTAAVVGRLRHAARGRLGLELEVGSATFPEEELTFSGLLQRAESRMAEPSDDEDQPSTKGRATELEDTVTTDLLETARA